MVYYWRKKKSTSEPGAYRGPARVICQEDNSLVWLSDGRHLIRAAPEQLRLGCELDEELVSAEEACRVVNISDVLKSSRHGGIEDISSEDPPDNNHDDDNPPEDLEDHNDEDEQDDKSMGIKIPPMLRPELPAPGEAIELGPKVDLQRREAHRKRYQENHRRRIKEFKEIQAKVELAKNKKKTTTTPSTQAPIAVEDKKKTAVVVEGFVENRVRTLEAERTQGRTKSRSPHREVAGTTPTSLSSRLKPRPMTKLLLSPSPTRTRASSVPVEGVRRSQRVRAPPERFGFEQQHRPPPDKTPRLDEQQTSSMIDDTGGMLGDGSDTSWMDMITEVCEININIDQRDVEVWMNDLLPEKTGLLDLILTNSEEGWSNNYNKNKKKSSLQVRRDRIEIKMRDLDANDRKLILEAKKKELATFMQYKAIKMLSRQGISKNKLVPMKWVLTWKEVDEDGTKKKKGKARLVAIGYKDPESATSRVEAPTQSRVARNVQLQVARGLDHDLIKGDISGAFLQGEVDRGRHLYGVPPKDVLKILGVPEGHVMEFLKQIYGLTTAPRGFFLKVVRDLKWLGWEPRVGSVHMDIERSRWQYHCNVWNAR